MKKKTLVALGVSLFSIGVWKNTPVSQAAAEPDVENVTVNNNDYMDSIEMKAFNEYIKVKDNQYVISSSAKAIFSEEQLNKLQFTLDTANENVRKGHLRINSKTKDAEKIRKYFILAKYNKHYTYAWKPFGARYYFTSNAAVTELAHKFRSHANNLSLSALAGPAAGIIGGMGSWYYNKIADDLEYYNSKHPHNQIYMDLNWGGTYSFHILK